MSERKLFFIYEKNKYEYKKKFNLINESILSFSSILNRKPSELCFIYNGKNLTFNSKVNINSKYLSNGNKDIFIFVFLLVKKEKQLIQSYDIICPKCKYIAILDINKDIISINNCINEHNITDLSFKDFLETQIIEEKEIKCYECGNNKKLYESNFYLCSCKKYLCPLCIFKHGSHKQVFYTCKYFQCDKHGINFISYCKICKKNLCNSCESEHSKEYQNHKIILYKEKALNKNEISSIKDKIEKDNIKIQEIKRKLSKIELIFNEIFKYLKNNIEGFSEFNKKILKASNKIDNFESIITLENYNKSKNNILLSKEINDFLQNDNKNRLQYIVDLFEKVFNNQMSIIYKKKDGDIRLFGDEFVKKNKNRCYLIINGKKNELINNYNFTKDYTNNNLEIKLIEEKLIYDFSYMFSDCDNLLSLSQANKWNTTLINDMNHMFYKCSSLSLLEGIDKWNISNVQTLNYMFYNCSSLVYLPDISVWNTNKIEDISYMFYKCSSLKYLPDISLWDTQKVNNMSYFCYNCSSLEIVPDFTKWNIYNIKNLNQSFSYCPSIINFPNIYHWRAPYI